MNKKEILDKYRNETNKYLENLSSKLNKKSRASLVNKFVNNYRDTLIRDYITENKVIDSSERLNRLLLISYASYIVMLEARNKCWPYEYMAFSRRIGELWEPFCKIPFYHPINKNIAVYKPMMFSEIQEKLKKNASDYIEHLSITNDEKEHLIKLYENIWHFMDSESINMLLDLHIKKETEKDSIYYDIDYKSGFSSNEKGNTNRLLMVAGIYNSSEKEHHNILLVRQEEDQNNHYLKKLKNSGLWEIYCGEETYDKIKELTGFNLKAWMNNNMDWNNDITSKFKKYLEENNLIKYLSW